MRVVQTAAPIVQSPPRAQKTRTNTTGDGRRLNNWVCPHHGGRPQQNPPSALPQKKTLRFAQIRVQSAPLAWNQLGGPADQLSGSARSLARSAGGRRAAPSTSSAAPPVGSEAPCVPTRRLRQPGRRFCQPCGRPARATSLAAAPAGRLGGSAGGRSAAPPEISTALPAGSLVDGRLPAHRPR